MKWFRWLLPRAEPVPLHGAAPNQPLQQTAAAFKRASGKGLFVAGVKLGLGLTEPGLIDEYEFVVQPRLLTFEGVCRRAALNQKRQSARLL